MSDDRLKLRLVQAGYQAEDVGRLDRQGLLQTYAACLADEEDERRARAAAEAEGPGMLTEAAAAVFGDQYMMVDPDVMAAVNVQQAALNDQAEGRCPAGCSRWRAGRWSTGCCHVSVEIVSWFASLDHLFDQLCVLDDLRTVLVRPYLNDRAKNLLSRCDPSKSQDYKVVKNACCKNCSFLQVFIWRSLTLKISRLTRHTINLVTV